MDDKPVLSNAEVIANLARAGQGILSEDATPFVIKAPEHTIESVERFCTTPAREKGTTTVDDLDSFIRHVTAYTDADSPAEIYWRATETSASFQCVFNADSWRDFRVVYTPAFSPEWIRWTGQNGKRKEQVDFARFVEDNAVDVVSPASADMIEISRSLEATKKVSFSSGIRLSNGETSLNYEEQIQGTAAKGKLSIPDLFKIGIPVFVGGERYGVETRLRYRIDQGQLSMWYDLIRPHVVLQDAVETMVKAIADKVKLPMYRGELGLIPPA